MYKTYLINTFPTTPLKMIRNLLYFLLSCSCVNVSSVPTHQPVNIDQAQTIPKAIAASYANELAKANLSPHFKVTFTEREVIINREVVFMALDSILNKKYNYDDLFVIAEKLSITGTINDDYYVLVLIHSDDLNSPDLYHRDGKFFNPAKCLFNWAIKTPNMPEVKFKKFLSALVSLGVQVPDQNPRDLH